MPIVILQRTCEMVILFLLIKISQAFGCMVQPLRTVAAAQSKQAGSVDSLPYFGFFRFMVGFVSTCSFKGFARSYPLATWQLNVQDPPVGVLTNTMRI